MHLELEAYAARLPELGTSPEHALLLLRVLGAPPAQREAQPPVGVVYRDPGHPAAPRAPLCMAFAIDASSSMRGPRFALALQAVRSVLDSLAPADRVALVTFDRDARVVLDPVALDEAGRRHARATLDRLATGRGTNIGAGWREASDALLRLMIPGAARRVLLLTDGHPSKGEREPEVLARWTAEGQRRGIETTVVGVGDGIDEALCTQLARAGEGRFHYLRDEGLLGDVVANEVEGARRLAATEVSLVLALSSRVVRAQLMHRYPCQPDGRTLEVRLGAVAYGAPREVLVQVEVERPDTDAVLGVAAARGRAVLPRRHHETERGFALGARGAAEPEGSSREAASERCSLSLPAGPGEMDARRRVAEAVLVLRTMEEIRSAWDGVDARDAGAVARRLGRARELRRNLLAWGLVDPLLLAALPDLDAMEAAMRGDKGPEQREVRRTFASWAHNTHVSQIFPQSRKGPKD